MGNTRQDALVAGLEALFTAYPPDDTYGVQVHGGSPGYYRMMALEIARDPMHSLYGVAVDDDTPPALRDMFTMASGTGVPDDVLRALITLIYPESNLER